MNVFSKIAHAARIEATAASAILRHGWPDVMLQFGGGIGDELLLTTVSHELKRRNPSAKIWQVSHSAELLYNNPDYHTVFTWDQRLMRYAFLLNTRRKKLSYAKERIPRKEEIPPVEHILAVLCRQAGIKGSIELRPYLFLKEDEIRKGRLHGEQIVVQCIGEQSYPTVMLNKLWSVEKFQYVVDILNGRGGTTTRIVQIGGGGDPLLQGVTDLRGRTTLRESAALLHEAQCFVGTVGLGMHLARAVGCRSVIIYGGREHSWQSGYTCNENLDSMVECAPCWLWNDCDYERKCMTMISANHVISAVERITKRLHTPLETDTAVI